MRRYTNEQLEEIASVELEKAKKYKGLYNKDLINIDLFAEVYLGLEIEYKELLDTKKLAMLVMNPMKVVARIDSEDENEDEILEIVAVQGKTILINLNESNNRNEGGLRFSIAHEIAHWILHRFYLESEISDDIEVEANYLAAALLMPKEKFKQEIELLRLENDKYKGEEWIINKLAEKFNVSKTSARIRMECIMGKSQNKSSQSCVHNKEDKPKKTKSAAVTNYTCLNQQLSYEITEEFLKESYVYENNINKSFIYLYEKIKKIAKDKDIEQWKIETLLNIPKKISQLEPYQFIAFNECRNKFYSLNMLSKGQIIQINSRFKKQIEKFVSNNLEVFNEAKLELDKLDFSVEESKRVSLNDIDFNEELISMKILRDISSKNFEYDGKIIDFLPCYNVTTGIEVISDLIEDNEFKDVIRRYSFVIQPNIVEYRNKKYFEPKILLRRFISSILTEDSLGTQFRSESNKYIDLNRTIFIKCDDKFITVRIAKKKDLEEDEAIKIRPYYKDYFIFKEIKENMDIGIENINSALFAEKANPDILIAYHTSMKYDADTKMGVGVHSNDKVLIKNHILKSCEKLKLIEPIECIVANKKDFINISGSATDQGKLKLDKVFVKNNLNEVDLYVFRIANSKFKLEDYIRRFIEHPSIIKKEKYKEEPNIEKINNNQYSIKLYNKTIIFNIIEIISDKIAGRKILGNENYEDRKKIILNAIGKRKENSIAIVLIDDLRKSPNVDSKSIIRTALNSIGIVNQFIIDDVGDENKTDEDRDNAFDNKTRAAMLDLLNDIGFVNASAVIKDKVVYSFWGYRIGKKDNKNKYIPFIIRTDFNNIEFMILEGNECYEWMSLFKANSAISNLGSWLNSSGDIEELTQEEVINEIIEEINEDSREKIVIVSHENNFENNLFENKFKEFINASVVMTNISATEVIQYHKTAGNTGITSCIYKIDDNYYRSYGQKVIGMEQNSTLYKKDYLKKEYKHRNLLDIKILRSNLNNNMLAEIIHRLRLPLTSNIHANMDILTEHLTSFERHIEGSITKSDK
ncbi:ImmA/IrrE family metallo-endopeptidase [Clostridium sp.]|uniref:ImmA/IrrE family metallo-endopeptidase n=1 Tax=Clostridium sp. TaxID=1506 RepID=UPI0025C73F75|nr:ImmA/IrrE family metallo-endopeptidase [Clostridium sp.]